jgi:hypothetical protein
VLPCGSDIWETRTEFPRLARNRISIFMSDQSLLDVLNSHGQQFLDSFGASQPQKKRRKLSTERSDPVEEGEWRGITGCFSDEGSANPEPDEEYGALH